MSSSGAGFHRITPSPVKGYPDAVNAQIAELCEQALTRAHALLMQHQHAHTAVAERLLADDTLTGAQVREQVEAFPADPSIYEKGDL